MFTIPVALGTSLRSSEILYNIYYLKMLFAKFASLAAFVVVSTMQVTPAGAVCASGQMGTFVVSTVIQ
jgi:hypothetical protein